MANLINELLDISAIHTGELKMKFALQDPVSLFRSAIEMFEIRAKEKEIELRVDFSQKLPMIIYDYNRMLEVLSNFISNALKFCQQGDTIIVGACVRENYLDIWVKDTGPGIKEEEKEKLFQPFQKLSNRPTGGESSTGLGLSITKEIVSLHSGDIKVESTYGEGSQFTIHLPITSLDLSILWVDDEEDLTELIVTALTKKLEGDVRIFAAKNAQEALIMLEKKYFDLVVIDIMMPEINGIELMKIILEKYPEKKIILATAHGDRFDAQDAISKGALAYILKPFDVGEVKKVIKRVLNLDEKQEEK